MTTTFKQVKTALKKDGFDSSVIPDPLYFLDPSTERYEALTPELYQAIQSGQIRF